MNIVCTLLVRDSQNHTEVYEVIGFDNWDILEEAKEHIENYIIDYLDRGQYIDDLVDDVVARYGGKILGQSWCFV